jgi:hypothetical protein
MIVCDSEMLCSWCSHHPRALLSTWQVSGYGEMLSKVRTRASRPHVILTESNAEPFMDGVNLFLTLVGFQGGDPPSAPSPVSARTIVPAFQAVYGGYVLAVGAEFFRQDLTPDPDVFAAKVAVQFSFGAQMGWFSLGGRDNQQPPMGVYDLLMSHMYDAEVAYLRALSRAKQIAARWFNFGRALRPLALAVNRTVATTAAGVADADAASWPHGDGGGVAAHASHPRSSRDATQLGLAFGDVMSSAWLADDAYASSLLATFTAVKRATPAHVRATIDLREYGFAAAAPSDLFDVYYKAVGADFAGPWQKLGSQPASAVVLDVELGVRAVVLMRVEPARV